MPLYEYICQDCGAVTELQRPMDERHDPTVCRDCGSDDTELAISRSGFILKGTGWYATDYATKKD